MNAPTTDDSAAGSNVSAERREADSRFAMIAPQRRTLGVVIRTYKAAVTTACHSRQLDFAWQRNYYEHIVRNEQELAAIRRYIRNNPLKWALDRDNPANPRQWPPATTGADYLRELDISGAQQ